MLYSTPLLGIKITTSVKKDIILFVQKYLQNEKAERALTIFTPNPEQIVDAQSNNFFKHILNESDINLPDGTGIVWGLKQVSSIKCHVSRISGVDFMQDLIQLAAENDYPVAFIGGREGVAQLAFNNLKIRYPSLKGFAQDGPDIENQNAKIKNPCLAGRQENYKSKFKIEDDEYFKQLALRIKESGVKLVFVGLGAPKQEMVINSIKCHVSSIMKINNVIHDTLTLDTSLVFMSVGGSFDIFSGKLKRAPKIFQQLNLEWLWRLIQEPWRLGRQLKLIKFVYLVLKASFVLK